MLESEHSSSHEEFPHLIAISDESDGQKVRHYSVLGIVLGHTDGYHDAMRVGEKMENIIRFISLRNIPGDPDEESPPHEHQE